MRRYLVPAALAGLVATPAFATVSVLPTEIQPAALVTLMSGEAALWMAIGVPLIIGLTFAVALVRGFRNKGKGIVK